METRIILWGDPRSKKNSQRVISVKGQGGRSYTKLLPSKAYEDYEKDCLRQITGDKRLNIDHPVNMKCVYFMKTRRRVDLQNLVEATADILVKAGVLADDNCNIVASLDGSRVDYDKEDPRVEITITDKREQGG